MKLIRHMKLAAAVTTAVFSTQLRADLSTASLLYSPGSGDVPAVRRGQETFSGEQSLRTGGREVREILFADGTTLVIGSNSDVSVLEPVAQSEALVIVVRSGVVKVVGPLVTTRDILIRLPEGTVRGRQSALSASVSRTGTVVELHYLSLIHI